MILCLINIHALISSLYSVHGLIKLRVHDAKECRFTVFFDPDPGLSRNCLIPRTDYGSDPYKRSFNVSACVLRAATKAAAGEGIQNRYIRC